MSKEKLEKRITQAAKELVKLDYLNEEYSVLLSVFGEDTLTVGKVNNRELANIIDEANTEYTLATGYDQLIDDGTINDGELVVLRRNDEGEVQVILSHQEDGCES